MPSPRRPPCRALVALGLAAVLATAQAGAAEVWKWVDAQGLTHYGPAPPDDPGAKAERLDLPDTRVSEGDRKAAQWRSAKDKVAADRAAAAAAGVEAPARPPRAAGSAAVPGSCAEAWRRYEQSQACFDRYRHGPYGRSGVQPEAWQHCTEVAMPDDACR